MPQGGFTSKETSKIMGIMEFPLVRTSFEWILGADKLRNNETDGLHV